MKRALQAAGEVVDIGKTEWTKVGKGFLIALAGAALTYVSQWIAGTDFGDATPVVVAGWSVAVNYARKWLSSPGSLTL